MTMEITITMSNDPLQVKHLSKSLSARLNKIMVAIFYCSLQKLDMYFGHEYRHTQPLITKSKVLRLHDSVYDRKSI